MAAKTVVTLVDLNLTGYKRLHSIVVADRTASPGAVGLMHVRGGSVTGTQYLTVNVGALGVTQLVFNEPLWIPEGIFLDAVSGEIRATVQVSA